MGKVKVGIIGCGGIAFGKHMPSLAKVDQVEMVAFFDIVTENAARAKKEYGTDQAKIYDNYQDLLAEENIDVVHICTPNKSHAQISIDALEAGKHVMCEKPMARNSVEAKKMVETAKKNGKKLTIGYQNRYRTDSQYLYKLCRRGDLGDIYFAKAHAIRRRSVPCWGRFLDKEEQGGGPLIDIGTHALDLTLWMMDNYKPKTVIGTTYNYLGKLGSKANAWGTWKPEEFTVEDSAFGFITMENGATIILESSWALNTLQTGEAKTTLAGTLGGADMQAGLRINGEEFGELYTKEPLAESTRKESAAEMEARLWIEAIINDTEPVVKAEQALVITQILEAIYKSAESGKPVSFS